MPKRASFTPDRIPTTDEILDARGHEDRTPEEELQIARGERVAGMPDVPRNYRYDPDYASKNRAQELMSMQVIQEHSPSTRFNFDPNKEAMTPWSYRWMDPATRLRKGMKGYVAVQSIEEAKGIMKSPEHCELREGEDGKIYSGNLFLAKVDRTVRESRVALAYQRSQRLMKAAQAGEMNPLKQGGVHDGKGVVHQAEGETLASIHDRTSRRLGKKGVQVETSFEDDYPNS
jgi:hypothetical protein